MGKSATFNFKLTTCLLNFLKLINFILCHFALQQSKELQPSYTVSAPRTLQSTQSNNFHQLENPLVLGSILAGVVGVVIIAVIILGVWIRSRMLRGGGSKSSSPSRTRQNEHVEIDSTVITSSISMSTLDFDENEETQMESLQLDDTTFYSANDVSIPVERGEFYINFSSGTNLT